MLLSLAVWGCGKPGPVEVSPPRLLPRGNKKTSRRAAFRGQQCLQQRQLEGIFGSQKKILSWLLGCCPRQQILNATPALSSSQKDLSSASIAWLLRQSFSRWREGDRLKQTSLAHGNINRISFMGLTSSYWAKRNYRLSTNRRKWPRPLMAFAPAENSRH